MKTLIFVNYDAESGETAIRFTDEFLQLIKEDQLEIAEATRERMDSLIVGLQDLIRRSSSNNS